MASKSALVKPALIATANPCKFKDYTTKQKNFTGSINWGQGETCTISGESSPHMSNPITLFVFAQTISFMKTRSGSPERVAFKGLKLAVKTSMSPYSFTACNNHYKVKHKKPISAAANKIHITCSSVRPTCPIGGWENTADGTALLKKEKKKADK